MISKKFNIQKEEPKSRSVLSRDCSGSCSITPLCLSARTMVNFTDFFLPSDCDNNIPDDIIRISISIDNSCAAQAVIDSYIIPNCREPCVNSVVNNNFTIFEGIYGNEDSIVLDPSGCCRMSKAFWEAVFFSLPITSEDDPNWLRLCFIEDSTIPSLIPITPLGLYSWNLSASIITFQYGEVSAFIAPLSRSNCFTYIELQPIRWVFPDDNAIICNDYRREKIDTIMAGSLCICIGELEEREPIDPFNLKEDYEVLTGLTIGADLWQIERDIDDLTKIIISRSI
jgi:hypothetical protein